MIPRVFLFLILFFPFTGTSSAFYGNQPGNNRISIEWQNEHPVGHIGVIDGNLEYIKITKGKGIVKGDHFEFKTKGTNRIEISFTDVKLSAGSGATVVSIATGFNSFSFFLRDVWSDYPIWIPQYNVIVSRSDDKRSYGEIENDIKGHHLMTKIQGLEKEPEESFDSAAMHTRNQACPTWLGISRDVRIFEAGIPREMEMVTPRMASSPLSLPETNNTEVSYIYLAGRGQSVEPNATRRLEDGILPILHSSWLDDEIKYYTTSFVSLETSPLRSTTAMGTHFLVADSCSYGHMFTPEQQALVKSLITDELYKSEETVFYFRAEASNTSFVPRYAWFRTLRPGRGWWEKLNYTYNKESGFSSYSPDRVFGISKLNGKPLPDEEIAVLLKPGEKAIFEFYLPHSPVSADRALQLSKQSFSGRFDECRQFWQEKLSHAARIKLPEKRIEEMIRAGLLHLDLITYGREPEGTLAPSVGVYSPSAPKVRLLSSSSIPWDCMKTPGDR